MPDTNTPNSIVLTLSIKDTENLININKILGESLYDKELESVKKIHSLLIHTMETQYKNQTGTFVPMIDIKH